MNYDSFLRFIFPDGLFDYFELTRFNELSDRVEIHFAELNTVSSEYANDKLESKGFYEEVRMHDYPMRGCSCILFIKKRPWYNHTKGKYVSRNWQLMAEGMQVSSDFASFLKAMDRLSRHQHEHYGLDGKQLESQYKNHLSSFRAWNQLSHLRDWVLFEKNIGAHVGLDEICFSRGELYMILSHD